MSDDENDLEQLRLAALQTLMKPAERPATDFNTQAHLPEKGAYNSHNHNGGWRKFPSALRGGPVRNAHFTARKFRNANLISIQTLQSHNNDSIPINNTKSVSVKLELPQNRYCNKLNADDELDKKSSTKFSRYDDKSDSDSDVTEHEASDGDDEKLVRSNSLEALVQELEFEISGEKAGKPAKTQLKKAKVRKPKAADAADAAVDDCCKNEPRSRPGNEAHEEKADDSTVQLFDDCLEQKIEEDLVGTNNDGTPVNNLNNLNKDFKANDREVNDVKVINSPCRNKNVDSKPVRRSPQRGLLPRPTNFKPRYDHPLHSGGSGVGSGCAGGKVMYTNGHGQLGQARAHDQNHVYNHYAAAQPPYPLAAHNSQTGFAHSPPMPHYFHTRRAPRSLSPLSLGQESGIGTITMAPLSPRSAAFVLQNREIIEKRKRSPRHSYSRSPSPRGRRSKTPRKRSLSPRRYPRSSSPRKQSPHKRGRSPPMKRKPSPLDRSPKRSVKDRLTFNASKKVERPERKLTPELQPRSRRGTSPDKVKQEERMGRGEKVERKDDKERGGVLEARRRKFEQPNAATKEGVIRLKPSEEPKVVADDQDSKPAEDNDVTRTPEISAPSEHDDDDDARANEENDHEDEGDLLDVDIDDLFSDEESEDENEGRFKSRDNKGKTTATGLNFTALSKSADIQTKALDDTFGRDRADRNRTRRRSTEARRSPRPRDRRHRDVRKHRTTAGAERKDRDRERERVEKKDDKRDGRRETGRDDDSQRRGRDVDKEKKEDKKTSVKTRLAMRKDDESKTGDKRAEASEKKSDRIRESDRLRDSEKEKSDGTVKDDKGKNHSDAPVVEVKGGRENREKPRAVPVRKVIATNASAKANDDAEAKPKDDVTVIEDDDEQDVIKKNEAGDLRAQLSRKRAERQHQKPTVKAEAMQSRLLHNALGAVFQKSKRSEVEAAPKGKLPIHKRLGLNDEAGIAKRKIKRSSGDQV